MTSYTLKYLPHWFFVNWHFINGDNNFSLQHVILLVLLQQLRLNTFCNCCNVFKHITTQQDPQPPGSLSQTHSLCIQDTKSSTIFDETCFLAISGIVLFEQF